MKISFCTTVMNRVHHLQETLPNNLESCNNDEEVEFVILDYNSKDGLADWMKENIVKFGTKVKNYHTKEPQFYNRSHSRNMAFRLAKGEILVNLDADNFVGEGFVNYLKKTFAENNSCFVCPSHDASTDTFGKVAFAKNDFYNLKGYDEAIECYGFEDFDIKSRLLNLGRKDINFSELNFLKAISHTTEERIKNERIYGQIDKILVHKIDYTKSTLILTFRDYSFESASIIDKYFEYEKNSFIKPLELLNRYIIEPNSIKSGKTQDLDLSYFEEITADNLKIDIIHYYSQLKNKSRYLKNQETGLSEINKSGFGCGVVYFNFDYDNPITLS
ncbi:MAG: glycosyltransferase family 2 protein [Spirosomataceae bacterium]